MEIKKENPTIVTSVTLGKELHAGHMLLLATADLLKNGLSSEGPIVLVNNNTGPRAAGAVLALSKQQDVSVEEAALKLSRGQIPLETIVDSYRQRIEDSESLFQVAQILDEGNIDIFAATAQVMNSKLTVAGFAVRVVSEGANLPNQQRILAAANPTWAGSGFNFITIGKAIKILEKGGQLTATGKGVVSLSGLASSAAEESLMIFVDASIDTIDATNVFSAIPVPGRALQLSGAGIGFEGRIASGSKGEALTIREILNCFGSSLPEVTLNQALRQIIMTQPATLPNPKMPDLATAFYDFKDNDSFVRLVEICAADFLRAKEDFGQLEGSLKDKLAGQTIVDSSLSNWIQFLDKRTQALLRTTPEDVVRSMGSSKVVNPKTELPRVLQAIQQQGYSEGEADMQAQKYLRGELAFITRGNPFLAVVEGIRKNSEKIESLSESDFLMLSETLQFCRERLGYG